MRRLQWGFAVGALAASLVAAAETVYVTDQITVGLRADVTPDAPVVKTVSTGAALEVIERNGSLAKVRDGEGAEGWVESTALSTQPPAAQQLKSVRAELDRTRGQLANVQSQLDKARASAAAPDPAADKLKAELTSARTQLAEARNELKQKEEQLKQKEAEIAAAAAAAAAVPEAPATAEAPSLPLPEGAPKNRFSFLWLGIAFAMLVVGFIGGIVWVKESIRRRMGGLYLRI